MLDTINRMESEVRGYVRSYPTVFDTATNATLHDAEGKRYIDFFAGAGALNYGHNNPYSKQALLDYLSRDGIQHALDMATSAKVRFIETFESLILKPRDLRYKLQFTGPTGTNAVEAAIKLARSIKRRSHIVAFTNAYHGHTLGSLALTGNQYYHHESYGSRNNVTHIPFDGYHDGLDSVALLRQMLEDPSSGLPKPAAVVLETIQCEGGVNVARDTWLSSLCELCREHDILFIADDIQVGNGRSGTYFSFEPAGLRPDIVCLSKAIGGGLPMSMVLIDPDLDAWKPGQHTGTFRGNNLAFVASQAVLEQYWQNDDLMSRVSSNGEMIRQSLQRMAGSTKQPSAVRGRGMVWGLDLGNGEMTQELVHEAFSRGLIVETAGAQDHVLKILPPLTIEESILKEGLQIVETAFCSTLADVTTALSSDCELDRANDDSAVPS